MIHLNDHYDWVVLGDHPGAYLSGCLAARLGFTVLVVPFRSSAKLIRSKTDRFLDLEPNFVLGLGSLENRNGLIAECLSRLGIPPSDQARIEVAGSEPQVLTPDSRLELSRDRNQLLRNWVRECAANEAQVKSLLDCIGVSQIPILDYWGQVSDRLTLSTDPGAHKVPLPFSAAELRKSLLRKLKESGVKNFEHGWPPPMKSLLEGIVFSLTEYEYAHLDPTETLQALSLANTGASFHGGLSAYRDILIKIAKKYGVHVMPQLDCRRLFIQDGRFVGVQVSGRGNMISVRGGVLGCALDHTTAAMTFSGKKKVKQVRKSPVPRGWRFSVALTVGSKAIPPGLGRRIVWKEDGAPPLEIEMAGLNLYGHDEPEKRILYLRTVVPFENSKLQYSYLRMLAARMYRQATEIIPFLEQHVLGAFPDFISAPSDSVRSEFHSIYPWDSVVDIPEHLRFYQGSGLGSHSGVDGLFVATGESYPGLGMLGSAVAALEGIAWISHRSGIAGPLV